MAEPAVYQRIGWFIERSGKNRSEIARLCDVAPAAVTQWASGATGLRHENLARFCDAVGITMAEFWSAIPDLEPGDAA